MKEANVSAIPVIQSNFPNDKVNAHQLALEELESEIFGGLRSIEKLCCQNTRLFAAAKLHKY